MPQQSQRITDQGVHQTGAGLPVSTPVDRTTLPLDLEHAVRTGRAGQPEAEVGQQRRIESGVVKTQPAGRLPPQVKPQLLHRLEIRQPVRGLQSDRRARIFDGIDGRPLVDGNMSANITTRNNAPRCSTRNANTLLAGISSRHLSYTSGPAVSAAPSPITTPRWPRRIPGGARTPRSSAVF